MVVCIAALIAALLAIVSASGPRGLRHYRQLQNDAKELSERNAALTADNERLRLETRRLRDDSKAVEQTAREDLGMIGRDEVVFTFEPQF